MMIFHSLAKYCIQQTQRLLQQRAKSVEALDHVISKHKDELKKDMETSSLSRTMVTNGNQPVIEVATDSDDDIPPAPPTRGRGRLVYHHGNLNLLSPCRGRGTKRALDSVRFDWLKFIVLMCCC